MSSGQLYSYFRALGHGESYELILYLGDVLKVVCELGCELCHASELSFIK